MARTVGKMVFLIACGVAVYVSVLVARGRAAANLCENLPVGSRTEDVETMGGTFFLTKMGPLGDRTIWAFRKLFSVPV